MKKRTKILLGIFIPIIIIGAGIGSFQLYQVFMERAIQKQEPPVLLFPVENTSVIDIIWGYGYHGDFFHGGIDFGCNQSVNIIASCNVTVTGKETWIYDVDNNLWQTSIHLKYNDKYEINIAFESWAVNETFANLQRDAIYYSEGETILQGNVIGSLLYHGSGCHIDFNIKVLEVDACPYQFFNTNAKATFDTLWAKYGFGDDSWYYGTPTT